jgi:Major Facilitator Superfamily
MDWEDDYEQAIADAGGFGLTQKIASFCLMVFRNQGNTFNYAFPFLLAKQIYDCRFDSDSVFESCSTEQICEAKHSARFVEY